MRLLVLPVLLVALVVGGCGAFDCPPGPDPTPILGAEARLEAAPVADTLTVVFVYGDSPDEISISGVPPRPTATADGSLRLGLAGDIYAGPRVFPRFETAARGDTVFVRRAPNLFRPACSYAMGTFLRVTRIEAPAGVRHVRVFAAWSEEIAFPTAGPLARPRLVYTV